MHYADINAALHKAGKPPVQLAKALKVHRSTVSRVIRGSVTSRRIARQIEKVTGIPVATLWPGRYARTTRKAG